MRVANYEYIEKIGQGSFGTVFKGRNVNTGEPVVIKTEPANVKYSSLKHESNILNLLYSKSCRNIPPTYWYGIAENQYRVFVMPYYEETVETAVMECSGLRNTLFRNIMRSAILILKSVHDKYVVHRDIKPANWMIRRNELVLIDFGLATFYVDSEARHISPAETPRRYIVGSPKYASWNIHRGEEYSRRDDLLSVLYIGLFCIEREYLWNNVPEFNPEVERIENSDIGHPRNRWFQSQKQIDEILSKTERWPALAHFARNVYSLSFHERPSYEAYAELF